MLECARSRGASLHRQDARLGATLLQGFRRLEAQAYPGAVSPHYASSDTIYTTCPYKYADTRASH